MFYFVCQYWYTLQSVSLMLPINWNRYICSMLYANTVFNIIIIGNFYRLYIINAIFVHAVWQHDITHRQYCWHCLLLYTPKWILTSHLITVIAVMLYSNNTQHSCKQILLNYLIIPYPIMITSHNLPANLELGRPVQLQRRTGLYGVGFVPISILAYH